MNTQATEIDKTKKIIMVVDDDPTISQFIKSLLEEEYEIVTKNDGHEAMVYLSEGNNPALILLDMEMPNMNGRVFIRRLRFGSPKHNKTPVIFVSSVSNKTMISSILKLGVSDYIIKPFKPEELVTKIHALIH